MENFYKTYIKHREIRADTIFALKITFVTWALIQTSISI
jgi:hypothetical protein